MGGFGYRGARRRELPDRHGFERGRKWHNPAGATEWCARTELRRSRRDDSDGVAHTGHGPRDPTWLSALEQRMAEHGVAIMAARSDGVARLNAALFERHEAGAFPSAQLNLDGDVDQPFAEETEGAGNAFREALERYRIRDAETGRTAFGPHVSDLLVRHTAKRMDARDCSTGEQKALLISIVLAQARQLSHIRQGFAPVLLLDEIVAHLDATRRAALFEEILALGAQAWMTGTEVSMFGPLSGHADIFEVAESRLAPI